MKNKCPYKEIKLHNGELFRLYNYTSKYYNSQYNNQVNLIVEINADKNKICKKVNYFSVDEKENQNNTYMYMNEMIDRITKMIIKEKAKKIEFYKNKLYFKNIVFDKIIKFPSDIVLISKMDNGYDITLKDKSNVFLKEGILTNFKKFNIRAVQYFEKLTMENSLFAIKIDKMIDKTDKIGDN